VIYNREYETMPRDDLEQLQTERLQSTLNRVCRNVAFYKSRFDENKIDIEKIKSIKDMGILPFTTKDDLRKSYPYNMFAVPLRDIIRIHSSTGRTGKPIAVGYTVNDIQRWSERVARVLAAVGITENDFVQIAFNYSMFTGAFGIHYGAEKLGASVIPSSSTSNIGDQILIMKDYKTSVLLSTPSYALSIASKLAEMKIHPDELNLKIGLFGAEPWSEKIRAKIEEKLHLSAYNAYGINELVGPGTAGECEQKNGLHLCEDHFIAEIINPQTLGPVKPGEEGELVFTTLTREGFPLIRYRTGDISCFLEGTCPCGRTTLRMKRVSARTDDMIVLRGVNIFPSQIGLALKKAGLAESDYRLVLENEEGMDVLEIQVGISESLFNDEIKVMVSMKNRIIEQFKDDIGLSPKISFVEPETLRGKTSQKRVIDNR